MTRRPTTRDLGTEQRLVVRHALLAVLLCIVVLAAATAWAPTILRLPPASFDRFALALQADLFIGLWVLVAIRRVSGLRLRSQQDVAGSAYGPSSPSVALASAFLQNTLEQAFIAIIGHLVLASLGGEEALAYILAAVALFWIGRIAFWIGYPAGASGRAFGMVTTMTPTIGAFAWAFGLMASQFIQILSG